MITGIAWVLHGISTTGLQSDLPNFNEAVTKCDVLASTTIFEEQLELEKTLDFTQKCYDEGGCFACSELIVFQAEAFKEFYMVKNGWFTQCLFAYDFNNKEYTVSLNYDGKTEFGINHINFYGKPIPHDADADEDIAYYEKYNCFSIPFDYLKKNFIDEDLKLRYSIHLYEKDEA